VKSLETTILRSVLAGTLAGALVGCGSGTLPHSEFARLPHDARQEIFDAENDLVIAKNREDAAEDRKSNTIQVSHELERRWQRTTKRLTAAGQGGRLPQARKVLDAEEAYLSAEVQVANAEIQTSRVETSLSRARLRLVRQRELAKIGRVTGASLKPLEATVTAYEAQLKAADAVATTVRTRAEGWLEAWKAAEDEYARASGGDYDTVVWVD
jgi:hypothetical protein